MRIAAQVSSFAIVRNPFSRMVSIYMYNKPGPLQSLDHLVACNFLTRRLSLLNLQLVACNLQARSSRSITLCGGGSAS